MFDVATSLIRFWESEFDIIKPKKNRKGNRQFTKEDIQNVKLIYHLVKEKGYTLQGAKSMLKNGMPMEKVYGVYSFSEANRLAKNAEEALLVALNACACTTKLVSEIQWKDKYCFMPRTLWVMQRCCCACGRC